MKAIDEFSHKEFQFHKGTIKTVFAAIRFSIPSNFNSIKVRLKREYNLIVVTSVKFQFHKGTIKTE